MNLIDKVQELLEQLISKNPKMLFNADAKISDILLLRDYHAKLKEVKVTLGIEEFYISEVSFHNLLQDIFVEWEEMKPSYQTLLDFYKGNGIDIFYLSENYWNGQFIYLFICWEILKDRAEIKKLNLLTNPYLSVFKLIERNHLISRREGFFYINDLIVFKFRYAILPSFQDDFLDFIDERNALKRPMPPNVPNSEQVLELWTEFQQQNY